MNDKPHDFNEDVLKKLRSNRWIGHVLTSAALSVGLLVIVAGVCLAAANLVLVRPMENELVERYSELSKQSQTNTVASPEHHSADPRNKLHFGHAAVTLAHGKELFLTGVAVGLIGLGSFLTLLLVIFNRRVTLRQINLSLAQISGQIKELQERGRQ